MVMSIKTPADPIGRPEYPELVHIGFKTTPDQALALRLQAKKRGIKTSSLIRGLVEEFLKRAEA